MTNDDKRSPEEIEREIERERSGLSETLEDLQSRFSVEHIARQFSDQFREYSGDFGRSVSEAVKRNPMALALTGIGLAWLMISDRAGDAQSGTGPDRPLSSRAGMDDADLYETGVPGVTSTSARDSGYGAGGFQGSFASGGSRDWTSKGYVTKRRDLPAWAQRDSAGMGTSGKLRPAATSSVGEGVQDAASATADAARSAGATAAGKSQAAATAVAEAGRSVADSARGMAGSAADMAKDMGDRLSLGTEVLSEEARARVVAARQRAIDASESALEYARRSGERAVDLFEEQPLIAGALALAVGAALGAALPRTRVEDEYFGEQSDQLMDEAERIFEEEKQKLAKVAEAATDEAKAIIADVKEKAESVAKTAVDQAKVTGSKIAGAAESEADKQDLGSVKKTT